MDAPTIWAAFFAGALSFISPCVLPLFPVYLSAVGAGPGRSRLRVFFTGLLVMLGFTIMFMAMMGPLIAFLGIHLVSSLPWIETLAATLFIVFGIWLLPLEGIQLLRYLKVPFNLMPVLDVRFEEHSLFKRKYIRAFMPLALGASLAIVWIPCVGPYLGVILLLAGSADTVLSGTYLLLVYCAGLSAPFLISALSLDLLVKATPVKRFVVRGGVVLKAVAGLAALGFGIVILTGNLTWLNAQFVF